MITGSYIESWGMDIAGKVYSAAQQKTPSGQPINKSGVAPTVARMLLKEGHSPDEVFRITRDGKPVLADRTLEWWAGIRIEEGSSGIHVRKFRAFKGVEKPNPEAG